MNVTVRFYERQMEIKVPICLVPHRTSGLSIARFESRSVETPLTNGAGYRNPTSGCYARKNCVAGFSSFVRKIRAIKGWASRSLRTRGKTERWSLRGDRGYPAFDSRSERLGRTLAGGRDGNKPMTRAELRHLGAQRSVDAAISFLLGFADLASGHPAINTLPERLPEIFAFDFSNRAFG